MWREPKLTVQPCGETDELLAAHAAGRLRGAALRVLEAHLVHDAAARAELRLFETVGGALLEAIEPEPLATDAWSRLAARLD